MNPAVPLLPPTLLARAAFELLASSSVERYARIARNFTTDAAVKQQLRTMNVEPADLRARIEYVAAMIAVERFREPSEVELTVLMAIVSQSGAPDADEILTRVAVRTELALRWPSAAARLFLAQRPLTTTVQIGSTVPGRIESVSTADHHTNVLWQAMFASKAGERADQISLRAA
ncbi:MAG: hypothetical protein HYY76_20900 [Acidobacteria bacterium]|nr:hypothetical protein [Acidobacteriota bacterium]